jgi:hypothetical protein
MRRRRCVPVTESQTLNDEAIDVGLGISGAVPNLLDWRIAGSRGSVDCVVLARDADYNGIGLFSPIIRSKAAATSLGHQ